MTDTNDVPALQDQLLWEQQQHVAGLLGQLPVQLLQLFGLFPFLQKDNLTMSANSQEQMKGQNQVQVTLHTDTKL